MKCCQLPVKMMPITDVNELCSQSESAYNRVDSSVAFLLTMTQTVVNPKLTRPLILGPQTS